MFPSCLLLTLYFDLSIFILFAFSFLFSSCFFYFITQLLYELDKFLVIVINEILFLPYEKTETRTM